MYYAPLYCPNYAPNITVIFVVFVICCVIKNCCFYSRVVTSSFILLFCIYYTYRFKKIVYNPVKKIDNIQKQLTRYLSNQLYNYNKNFKNVDRRMLRSHSLITLITLSCIDHFNEVSSARETELKVLLNGSFDILLKCILRLT